MCHDTTASPSWRIRFLCSDLWSFLSSYSNVVVRWVPRICNEAAHILAKWSLFCNFYGSFDVNFSPDYFSYVGLSTCRAGRVCAQPATDLLEIGFYGSVSCQVSIGFR